MRDPAHTRSVGLLLAGAVCWSLAGILFKQREDVAALTRDMAAELLKPEAEPA